jgi:hypothetical protein
MNNQTNNKRSITPVILMIIFIALLISPVFAQDEVPFIDVKDPFAEVKEPVNDIEDPFKNVEPIESTEPPTGNIDSTGSSFFMREFLILYENDSEKGSSATGSVGFEYYRLFSTDTRDIGELNIQMRLMGEKLLSGQHGTAGHNAGKAMVDWHNFYYTALNPLGGFGNFNVGVGNAAIPFGLEPEVDTHSSLLQLSGPANFGMKKDWGVNFFGSLGDYMEYSTSLTRGSGKHYSSDGNPLMGWGRISTSGKFNRENDSELGVSFAAGTRSPHTSHFLIMGRGMLHPEDTSITTTRVGLDYKLWKNPYVLTLEGSVGRDNMYNVRNILAQLDYVDPGDKWQTSLQYRDFVWDNSDRMSPNFRERALTLGFDWFFRNTPTNRNILSLNFTRFFSRINAHPANQIMLQYYLYF